MKILIVDDDIFFQKFYSSKLHESGFEIDLASDGQEGLTKIQSARPDLILLDLIMPIKDGFEVLSALSKDPALQSIPVIVFSTLGQDEDIEKAKSLGAKDVVNKSLFDYEALLSKIKGLTSTK